MRADYLSSQRVQRVEPGGVLFDPVFTSSLADHRLVVFGIHGAGDFVIGLRVGDATLERRGGETTDALRVRAMIELVPNLPPGALRDRHGSAVGYFVYAGLAPDYCETVMFEEGWR